MTLLLIMLETLNGELNVRKEGGGEKIVRKKAKGTHDIGQFPSPPPPPPPPILVDLVD